MVDQQCVHVSAALSMMGESLLRVFHVVCGDRAAGTRRWGGA